MQPERLCGICAEEVRLDGAGAMVLAAGGSPAPLRASDALAARIEELQFTLGEGPGIDAHGTGRPVAEPDLARPRVVRWPAFAGPALEAGAGALFSFPLRLGGLRLGALTLYRAGAGGLSDAQFPAEIVTV